MVVAYNQFRPTLNLPKPVVASRRQPRSMLDYGFYEEQNKQRMQPRLQEESTVDFSHLQDLRRDEESEKRMTTEDFIGQERASLAKQPLPPVLRPGLRVQNPNEALVDPANFQLYFQSLQHISQAGKEALGAERARAVFRQQEALQKIRSRQIPSFGGVQLQGSGLKYRGPGLFNRKAMSKSAPLRMLGSVQPYVRSAAQEISGLFGYSNIGGHATSGHIKGSDHYTGRALDVMGAGYDVVNYALQNAGRLGIKYIIYNRQFWRPGRKPTRYTGRNPHTGHVHLSFS